jgi:hypothetical protein
METSEGFGFKNENFCATQRAELSLFLEGGKFRGFCFSFFLIMISKERSGFHFLSILNRI